MTRSWKERRLWIVVICFQQISHSEHGSPSQGQEDQDEVYFARVRVHLAQVAYYRTDSIGQKMEPVIHGPLGELRDGKVSIYRPGKQRIHAAVKKSLTVSLISRYRFAFVFVFNSKHFGKLFFAYFLIFLLF